MKNNQHIIITGANGFIGSYLVAYFNALNFKVIALGRQQPKEKLLGVTYTFYDMKQQLDESVFESNSVLIHCAYSKHTSNNSFDSNENATQQLLAIARKKNITCVFFSSISATSTSGSYYANQKNKLEKLFNSTHDIILRPGLVIGNGGLFANTVKFITRFNILPMVGKGQQPVYYIGINDLVKALHELLIQQRAGTFYVCHEKSIPYKTFYKTVATCLQKKIMTLSLPLWFFKIALTVYGLLPKAKINPDNLKGLNEVPLLDTNVLNQSVFTFEFETLKVDLKSIII